MAKEKKIKKEAWGHSSGHSTHDELRFLDKLGTGVFVERNKLNVGPSRYKLLLGYQKGIMRRTRWDKVDSMAIHSYLLKLLEKEAT